VGRASLQLRKRGCEDRADFAGLAVDLYGRRAGGVRVETPQVDAAEPVGSLGAKTSQIGSLTWLNTLTSPGGNVRRQIGRIAPLAAPLATPQMDAQAVRPRQVGRCHGR
jgi:hypothetical protein